MEVGLLEECDEPEIAGSHDGVTHLEKSSVNPTSREEEGDGRTLGWTQTWWITEILI